MCDSEWREAADARRVFTLYSHHLLQKKYGLENKQFSVDASV